MKVLTDILSDPNLKIPIFTETPASDGNQITPKLNYKISFAMLDERNMKWNF
jgi:hypothetical protein